MNTPVFYTTHTSGTRLHFVFNLVEFIFTEWYLKAAEFDRLDNDPGKMDDNAGTATERTR